MINRLFYDESRFDEHVLISRPDCCTNSVCEIMFVFIEIPRLGHV